MELVGRTKELNQLSTFIAHRVQKKLPGSLYISGPPGTGKTACIHKTLTDLSKKKLAMTDIYVNCMNTATPTSVYKEILGKLKSEKQQKRPTLKPKQTGTSPAPMRTTRKRGEADLIELEKTLCSGTKMIVMILDEIDHLITSNHEILYKAFRWTTLDSSNLILIGIANSLDLTERLLPKLKLSPELGPELIKFAPYSKEEISAILKSKINEEGTSFDQAAVELCARKSSANTGDLRKALDICRRSLERTSSRKRSANLKSSDAMRKDSFRNRLENNNGDENGTPVKITCREVLETLNEVYSSPVQRSKLPIQQKLILATAIALKASGHTEFNMSKMTSSYRKACSVTNTDPVEPSEIKAACDMLEAQGLFSITVDKKNPTLGSKLKLSVDEKTARTTLNDAALISKVLNAKL